MQLKNKTTGQFIEVDAIDSHWYAGHEDYEVLHAETAKTIETEPWEAPKKEGVKNEIIQTSKSSGSDSNENGKNANEEDGNEAKANAGNEEKRQVLKRGRPRKS